MHLSKLVLAIIELPAHVAELGAQIALLVGRGPARRLSLSGNRLPTIAATSAAFGLVEIPMRDSSKGRKPGKLHPLTKHRVGVRL